MFAVLLELTWELLTHVLLSWNQATPRLLKTLRVSESALFILARIARVKAKLFGELIDLFLSCLIGARTTPSVVAFSEDGDRLIGDVAKRQVSILERL